MFFAFFIAVGILIGYATGGRLSNFQYVHMRFIWLVFAAAILRLTLNYFGFVQAGIMCADILILAFLAANIKENKVFIVAGIGFLCNVLVIAFNGFAMPVGYAVQRLPLYAKVYQMLLNGEIAGYTLATQSTKLYFLADIFYFPPYAKIGFFSVGDILLGIGGALCIVVFMKKKPAEKAGEERL